MKGSSCKTPLKICQFVSFIINKGTNCFLNCCFNHLVHQPKFYLNKIDILWLYKDTVLHALLALILSRIEIHFCIMQHGMTLYSICLIDFSCFKWTKIYCHCFGHEKPSLGGINPYIFFGRRPPKSSAWPLACRLPWQLWPPFLPTRHWR